MTGNVIPSDFAEQEETSIMESQKRESSEWTNVKHSLYLKSIEASFIDQLYNSLDTQSCQTQKTSSSNWKNSIPSGQFKVLQGGCWSNKKFKRENPWMQHFTKASPSLQERPLSTAVSQKNHVPDSHHFFQESGSSNSEVTDQNFVEEKSTEKPNRQNNRKRKRTTVVANSSNDQVVPFCISAEKK